MAVEVWDETNQRVTGAAPSHVLVRHPPADAGKFAYNILIIIFYIVKYNKYLYAKYSILVNT
jgi:hypothetical protein